MRALSATDDFISRSNENLITVREILLMELAPYSDARINTVIEDVTVSAKPATILALIFHELATNAAKYGSLSNDTGEVLIVCKKCGDVVRIDWSEKGGPPVQGPQRRGLGSILIEGGLRPYQGVSEMRFSPEGFACTIQFNASHDAPPTENPARTLTTNEITRKPIPFASPSTNRKPTIAIAGPVFELPSTPR